MKKRFLVLALTAMLGACSPKPMGDVYILISPNESPFSPYELLRLPSSCFMNEVECPTPEYVLALPENFAPFIWVGMEWSPNGKYALFENTYTEFDGTEHIELEELLLFDAMDDTIKTVLSGYKHVFGYVWNPDSTQAAVGIKSLDDNDMHIVLITPEGKQRTLPIKSASEVGYYSYVFNGQIFDVNQYPLEWENQYKLLFVRVRYPTSPSEGLVDHIFSYNTITGIETEIDSEESGTKFDAEFGFINRSPNKKWFSACKNKDNTTYVVSADMREKRKIMTGCPIYVIWMPDSDHMILLFLTLSDVGSKTEESHWYIASTSADTVREIIVPGLNLKTHNLNGIYVQPVKP